MNTQAPTSGEKLLKRLAQYRMSMVHLTVVIDKDGQPILVAVGDVARLEQLSARAVDQMEAALSDKLTT